MTVTSPKTEHHPGKDCRVIPLFPELRAILEEAFEAAPEGAVYVVDEKYRKAAMGKAGWRNCNLRTTFEKIVRRAGLTPWPRLFHNLRAVGKRNWPSSSRRTSFATGWATAKTLPGSTTTRRRTPTSPKPRPAPPKAAQKAAQGRRRIAGAAGTRGEWRGIAQRRTQPTPNAPFLRSNASTQLIATKGFSGWGGIRTPGGLSPTAVFKTAALDHSATHPNPYFAGFMRFFRVQVSCL